MSSTESTTETCACGARIDFRGWSPYADRRLTNFRDAHVGCRPVAPGMCGAPSAELVLGDERRTALCRLRAGHAGFHEDDQGCSWGFPQWHTHASGVTA